MASLENGLMREEMLPLNVVAKYRIRGLCSKTHAAVLEEHVVKILQNASIVHTEYLANNTVVFQIRTNLRSSEGARLLESALFQGSRLQVELVDNDQSTAEMLSKTKREKKKKNKSELWMQAKAIAEPFYNYVKADALRLERASDREELSIIFQGCYPNSHRRLEGLVLQVLRQRKLLRSKRFGDKVVVTLARTAPGDFSPEIQEDARARVIRQMQYEEEDKHGVVVSSARDFPDVVSPKDTATMEFQVTLSEDAVIALEEVTLAGPQKRALEVVDGAFVPRLLNDNIMIKVRFTANGIGLYRGMLKMTFSQEGDTKFVIARHIKVKCGDKELNELLKPSTPYKKKERRVEKALIEVVDGPKVKRNSKSSPFFLLPHHRIPSDVRQLIEGGELERTLQKPDTDLSLYADFWKDLLWANEHQAYEDIKLYDLEGAFLKREGRFMVLHVPGLAEGRPSVLRGDLVNVTWKGRLYKGLVHQTRLLEVLMELDRSFYSHFNPSIDSVDVRFTFSRTTFRTSHEGCAMAVKHMGKFMLTPLYEHVFLTFPRSVPDRLRWANPNLNEEQRIAVRNIVKGGQRPLPYIVFGPPGTGKTTTVVEAVFQLCQHKDSLNILLVAPSNDAADILVEKLSVYFPPSELRRIIAYSRTIDQVSLLVKPYVTDGLADKEMVDEIMSTRIIVSTVNLAARFVHFGVPRGHFNVLCVDEAGHATEPEVVSVASGLIDFKRQNSQAGQLILAGDPKQLGPVITSHLCKRFGLSTSYMERLTKTDVYARGQDGIYPQELLTKLIRSYRSHPSILELPNEMFYENELLVCGDVLSTHSLAKWEHLPQKGFPLIFHAVNGENLREGTSPSWFNPQEAECVVNYVDLLVNQSRPAVAPTDIGIVTPYARQAQKIRLALKHRNFPEIKVGSVESFQGQERRCIIISTVRADAKFLSVDKKYDLGFVANEKRFNVALTRAKALLVVVGCPSVLAADETNWLPFLKYCKQNNAWAGDAWDEMDGTDDCTGEESSRDDSLIDDWQFVPGVSYTAEEEGLGFINREE